MKAQHVLIWCLLMLMVGTGCATRRDPVDPWVPTNRKIDGFNMAVDRAVVRDVSRGYAKHVPEPVRTGVNNFFDNLTYLNVILNDYLQGNFAQGWRDTERMAVNTTVGILGVRDVATKWGRPRNGNDFGITLGKWGFKPGPYVVLPVFGPSTVRDVPGIVVARVTNPMFWINPPLEVSIPMDVTSFVDQRSRLEPQIQARERALDPYAFTRDAYLQYREAKIRGTAVPAAADSLYEEDAAPATQPAGADAMMRTR